MEKNRNSKRSINMLKKAFLIILKDKDISKITIKEVADLAGLTRNTFYAHFQDVYDLNESIEDDFINQTLIFIDATFKTDMVNNSLTFFKYNLKYVEEQKEQINALLNHGRTATFINKYSNKIIQHVLNTFPSSAIKDKKKLSNFLKILFSGSVFVIKQYLDNEIKTTPDELAEQLNTIYLNCYQEYIR